MHSRKMKGDYEKNAKTFFSQPLFVAHSFTHVTSDFVSVLPLAEQERIAARVRKIFATLDELH